MKEQNKSKLKITWKWGDRIQEEFDIKEMIISEKTKQEGTQT